MKCTTVAAIAACLTLAACATATPHTLATSYNPDEVAWSKAPGTNALSGNALLRTVGGEVRTCAGLPVWLVPVSRYAEERFTAIYGSPHGGYSKANIKFDATDPRYVGDARQTTCDSQGNFHFEKLPDGEYYVYTQITWGVPMSAYFTSTQGGNLAQRVKLSGGETQSVVLTAR